MTAKIRTLDKIRIGANERIFVTLHRLVSGTNRVEHEALVSWHATWHDARSQIEGLAAAAGDHTRVRAYLTSVGRRIAVRVDRKGRRPLPKIMGAQPVRATISSCLWCLSLFVQTSKARPDHCSDTCIKARRVVGT